MNSKQRKTLSAVFKKPPPANLDWDDIESLLLAVGCEIIEGNGSRVRFSKDQAIAIFHRPHPTNEAKRHHIRQARDYLESIGVTP
ncbi:type II toxin-antitoxin system HicA family toxin [Asticcacaulis sp. ZE23SCel15]|uniref:type II toxin-antitoxin system HicA family toxin n=1 Tax=Asticcacaulis sp. ZE23SCel15 TaxID=3059027 RepID=UPI00349E9E15